MEAKLVVVGGDAKAAEIRLKLPTIIGRGRDTTLTVPHPLVSRQHCELFESNGKLFVRDLGSLNGTYVNNERIEGDRELPSGDLLTIGAVTFRAVYDEVADAQAPAEPARSGAAGTEQPLAVPPTAATVQAADTTENIIRLEEFAPGTELSPGAQAEDQTDQVDNQALNAFFDKLE